ncbi:MAG: DEAD/DEAH box helicase family protein [Leuconostoc sp.]|uniref:DEAD/DEAH box helicase n=1 Tax=Leuconostoc sp. TaxID=1930076 RepID=UPI0039EB8FA1
MKRYYGRQIVQPKIDPIPKNAVVSPTFRQNICQRCGQDQRAALPNHAFYCRACLALGRVSTLDVLVSLPEPNLFDTPTDLTWQGQLTAQQQQVSAALLGALAHQREHLVWAVTGAGKTEMLFPVIAHALKQQQRVAVISPRIDVILELAPRLQAAFAHTPQVVLYGEQKAPYTYTQLVLATTHQMLRFVAAFDVVIIDEVDSFPFAGDAMLAFAVQKAKKPQSTVIYLTATPTKRLQQRVKQRTLNVSYLPLRFHQHLLPEIKTALVGNWRRRLPHQMVGELRELFARAVPLLVFVPHVADLAPVFAAIQQIFPTAAGDFVWAEDPQRVEKVQRMRSGTLHFLVTTTILERGVTFSGVQVMILGAEEPIFSASALVQIAGRVGRDQLQPTGLVQAYLQQMNFKVMAAQRQIKQMNQRGRQLGGQR